MKDIKIQNSNLFLRVIKTHNTNILNISSFKRGMRYQLIVVVDDKGQSRVVPSYGISKVRISSTGKNDYTTIILMKNRKKFKDDIKLSKDETVLVLMFLKEFIYYYPLECEALVKALRITSICQSYEKSFGPRIADTFIPLVNKNISLPDTKDSNDEFIWKDPRRRYSVIDFLEDLKNDPNARIQKLSDWEQFTDSLGNNVKYLDKPGEIVSVEGSMSRANIYVTYKSPCEVTDTSGNVKMLSSYKNISIVKDGVLSTDKIVVSVGNELRRKLMRRKMIYLKLLKDVYVIDLTKLPIANRSNISNVTNTLLTYYEYDYFCKKFQEDYIKYLLTKDKKKVPMALEPGINEDSGIYQRPYTKKGTSGNKEVVNVFKTKIVDSCFPENSTKRNICFNNKVNINPDQVAYKLMKEIDDSGKDLDKLYLEIHERVQNLSKRLSKFKLSLILSKGCMFDGGNGSRAYGIITTLNGKYGGIKVSWDIKSETIYN